MNLRTALRLGRVSNLPTVAGNGIAALALAGAPPAVPATAAILLALGLIYVAGMYLNDWFDRAVDARERPARPIPAGEARAAEVLAAGLAQLAGGLLLLGLAGGLAGLGGGAALAAAVLLYDWRHKGNPLAPLLMGLCRALACAAAALAATGAVAPAVALAGGIQLLYVAGITYAARREAANRIGAPWPLALLAAPLGYAFATATPGWQPLLCGLLLAGWLAYALWLLRRPAVPQAVAALIAGIALVDALLLALAGHPAWWAMAALLPVTVWWQRRVAGS